MYWGYKSDERFGDYKENLSKGRIFPRSFLNKPINDIISIYKADLYNIFGDLEELVLEINEELKRTHHGFYDLIISIPSFYKEKLIQNTIEEIKNQVNQNPTKTIGLMIYNNGYGISDSTLDSIKKSKEDILKTTKTKNLDLFVVSSIYKEKPLMSRIRSDIFDLLILSDISNKINEETIYLSFDADLRKIEDFYIKEVIDQHNSGYKVVIGDRNRLFEEEKYDDPFLYLQEKIFLMGEEFIYNRSEDENISTITNGRSSSFNLKSLLLIKGYERNFSSADDVLIGHKLNWFYGGKNKNKKIAKFIDKKIRSDGSRGSETIQSGGKIYQQRDPNTYNIKEERESKKSFYVYKNQMMMELIQGNLVNKDEIYLLEELLNDYVINFKGENLKLNKDFIFSLQDLLKTFFGNLCKYDFILSDNDTYIKIIFKT